jgi:DNA mismatch repair protein MutS2
MHIDRDTLANLEFAKILEYIASQCISELGKTRLSNSLPLSDIQLLQNVLTEIGEASKIYAVEGGIPLWYFEDIRPLLHKIEPLESYLEIKDCQHIQTILDISAALEKFFKHKNEKYPLLYQLAATLDPLTNLSRLINSIIDPSGSIYDNASPELKKIREQIAVISKQIHIRLERIIKKQVQHLQEDYVTLREGRLVLPVREYSVNKIPGIVHGQSATGQTHYIEPLSVVALNNEMQELYIQEKKEIIRILKRLADHFRQNAPILTSDLEYLTRFDVIQAKARYSRTARATAPIISEDFYWEIIDGYHPLLLKKIDQQTVPLSVKIGQDHRIMVITGPNAGGKTVVLKTVGLLQLMFQSGFHIPVKEGSRFPLCHGLFAVIGDEQSIENDLSTFSSHVTKVNEILQAAAYRSLILIDEIGTGTDPAEGAALAVAVLEKLNRSGIITMVTTHQERLKAFAHETEQVVNAAMQFDRHSLKPMFVLEIGIPGSSYAFDISRRLGLDDQVLNRARQILGSSHHDLEKMLADLADRKQLYDKKLVQLSIRETELEGLQTLYRKRAEELKRKRKTFEDEALQSARQIVKNVNKTVEAVIREIRESQGTPEIIKKGKKIIEKMKQDVEQQSQSPLPAAIKSSELFSGQTVRSKRFAFSGQITKIFKEREEVELESKGIKIVVPLTDLEMEESASTTQRHSDESTVALSPVLNELDVRGLSSDEALSELQSYLDQALHSGWKELRIIHGKGSGILRQKIHAFLKKNSQIKSFRLGRYGEGDTGVTVIDLT